jgi:hypothetical protein
MEYDQITCVLGEWQVFVRSGYCSAPSLLDFFFLPVNSYVTYPKIVCILQGEILLKIRNTLFISCQTVVKKKLCV